MFDRDAPAPDIETLTAWLKDHHCAANLYRGQVRDYPVMVPSFYRGLVIDLKDPAPIARVDPKRIEAFLPQARARMETMNHVITLAGIGLGNIIAQQYGLTSEALDVTESLDVAAFFATRSYPSYRHYKEEGLGVIYRFDAGTDTRLAPPYSLRDLDDLFERGRSATGFFDFFVQQNALDRVFDRDRWPGWMEGKDKIVATIAFSTSWTDLRQAISSRDRTFEATAPKGMTFLGSSLDSIDWTRTRFVSQQGGFIRPAIHWKASVPSRSRLVHEGESRGAEDDFGPDLGPMPTGPINATPLIVPSLAIKREMVGIENLRSRQDCQAFFFRHGPVRAPMTLRRKLWPEPSEDPLYGSLWIFSIFRLAAHVPDNTPAVDDPVGGILDRGYQVENEKWTRDARELDDLMRGQLEDVLEAIEFNGDSAELQNLRAGALSFLGKDQEAIHALIDGLRLDRSHVNLLLGLAEHLRCSGKPGWAKKAMDAAQQAAPFSLLLAEARAYEAINRGDFTGAAIIIDEGLARGEASSDWSERARLVILRSALAKVAGELDLYSALNTEAHKASYDVGRIDALAAELTGLASRLHLKTKAP